MKTSGLLSLLSTPHLIGPSCTGSDSPGYAVWSISVHPSLPLLASVDTSTAVSFWSLQADVLSGDDEAPPPTELISPSRTIHLSEVITPSGESLLHPNRSFRRILNWGAMGGMNGLYFG